MPSSTLQFFATTGELITLAKSFHHTVGGWATVMEYLPAFSLEVRAPEQDLMLSSEKAARTRRICFTPVQPCLQCESPYDFAVNNPNSLVLDFGGCTATGLRESAVGFKSDVAEVIRKWKLIAKKLKAETQAGLWVTSRNTSASAFYKNLRITPGAVALSSEGTQLLPLGSALVASVTKPETAK